MKQIRRPDPAEVREYREANQCSLREALAVIRKRIIRTAIFEATSIDDIRQILLRMMED